MRIYFAELPPCFTSASQTTEATEGETAKLSVTTSKPDQKVKWYRNGQLLDTKKQKKKYEQTTDNLYQSLCINNVTAADQGEYECVLDGIKERTTVQLVVQGKFF